MKRIVSILAISIFSSVFVEAGLFSHEEKVLSLCPDCFETMRGFANTERIQLSETNSNVVPTKEVALSIPDDEFFFNLELDILNKILGDIYLSSSFGRDLLRKIDLRNTPLRKLVVRLRIFFEIPIEFGKPNFKKPLWVSERESVHELYGAFESDGQFGKIALNNFQNRHHAPYIFIHELFHLLDGNIEENRAGDKIIDNFLAEYRAVLAEATFHEEYSPYLKSKGEAYKISKWHDKLNTETAVLEKTLDLLYPKNPIVVPVAKNSFDYLVESLGKNGSQGFVKIGFTDNSELLANKKTENLNLRAHVVTYFKDAKNRELLSSSYLQNLRASGLNKFDSIGGTRPSGRPGE